MFSLLELLVPGAGTLILGYLYLRWTSYRIYATTTKQQGCKSPPKYPHRDPIWGIDLIVKRIKAAQAGRQTKLDLEHFNTLGNTWEENWFGTKIFNTAEAKNIQYVTALKFQDFGKPDAQNFFKTFLGDGILSTYGAPWRRSRDLVKPIFSRSEVSDLDTLGFHVDRFLNQIPHDGSTVDLQQNLHNLFLDLSTEFIFGRSIEAQLPNDPNHSKEFLQAFNRSLMGVGKRRFVGKLHRIFFAFDKTWQADMDKVYAYIDGHVKRVLGETGDGSEKEQTQPTLSDSTPNTPFLQKRRHTLINEILKDIQDPIKLRYEILNVFMPGRDTSSIMLANCLFHLARNPEIWTELRSQILALGDQPLTFELLKSLSFFSYVIQETLRLQGPAGLVQRLALCDTMLPVGGGRDGKSPILVRKGEVVNLTTLGSNHSRDVWGDDVEEFKPQRWDGKRVVSTWEFTPFLGGPRICPAQQQVLTQSVYLLVRMTREFTKIENRDPVLEYVDEIRMLTESRNGVKVGLFSC